MGLLYNNTVHQCNFTAITDGIKSNGIKIGLTVSESSPAAMSVAVAVGSCTIDAVEYATVAIQNVSITNGDATYGRYDIITYDATADGPACVIGTPAAVPKPPSIPAGDILLGVVYIAQLESTSITNADIEEGRIEIGSVPTGIISMWHGLISAIPSGYLLCDGTNGTPDLRARFVRGAAALSEAGSVGGSDTHQLSIAEMPAHTHAVGADTSAGGSSTCFDRGDIRDSSNTSDSTGGDGAHNNMPAFYEILYIMKT